MLTPDQFSGWCCKPSWLTSKIPTPFVLHISLCQPPAPFIVAALSGETGMSVPVGLKPLESGTTQITSIGDTDRVDTMTQHREPLPCTCPCFSFFSLRYFLAVCSVSQGAADVTELSCNRSALAVGDSCAYIF